MDSSSPVSLAMAIATLIISFSVAMLLFLRSKRKRNYPPIAGTIIHQLLNLHRIADYMTEVSKKYKTFRMLAPSCNYVYIVDPANVEYILKSNFSNYGKGDFTHDLMSDFLGDGIFAVDGHKWQQQRKIASLEFSTKVLRDYSSVVFRSTASKLTKIVSELASSYQMMDIQDLLMKSTLDSIFKVGFGIELGALSGLEEGKAFSKAFDEASFQILYRHFDIFWKVKRFLSVGSEARMKKNLQLIDNFVYAIIEKKADQTTNPQQDNMGKVDILSRFLIEKEKESSNIDNKYLRDIILNFVIAGRDTTAGTLSWFFYLLSIHPHVQEKIAREVREATKLENENIDIEEFPACLTEKAISDMQYLQASLTETLRLYPAVPADVKCCNSDDTLPDGFDVNKGDMVAYQPYVMGRMEFLWGADAEEFRPERWINKEGFFEQENPFKFTAFQAGPRICLGKDFAYRQMKIMAATLLYFFKFELWDKEREVRSKSLITLQVDGGLQLRAVHR